MLLAQATGQGPIPIFPSAPNEFFARVAGISISFPRDSSGAVNGLVLHQNGDHKAPRLSASELPPAPTEIKLDAAALGDYVGKYQFNFGTLDVALKHDALEAQLTGQPALPIFASARDKFFLKAVDARLDFQRDAGGKVVAVVLHQNGRDMRAPRMADRRWRISDAGCPAFAALSPKPTLTGSLRRSRMAAPRRGKSTTCPASRAVRSNATTSSGNSAAMSPPA